MERQKRILITGFEAFAEHEHNPTEQLIKDIASLELSHIKTLLLPVSYRQAFVKLKEVLLQEGDLSSIICTGLAYDREAINLERVAINCESAAISDNDRDLAMDRPILLDGRAAYFSTLPIRKILEHLTQKGYQAKISNTAGTYVCNSLMYQLLNFVAYDNRSDGVESKLTTASEAFKKRGVQAGFIHYPPSTLNHAGASWTPQSILEATLEILKVCEEDQN